MAENDMTFDTEQQDTASLENEVERLTAMSINLDIERLGARFDTYRARVPLLQDPSSIYLNSTFAPPSNVYVAHALTRCGHDGKHLYRTLPWLRNVKTPTVAMAAYMNVDPSRLWFIREATSQAPLTAILFATNYHPGDNIVVLDWEPSNLVPTWAYLEAVGVQVRLVPVTTEAERTGRILPVNVDFLESHLDSRTVAIVMSSIVVHSGQRNDVASVCATLIPRGIHVIVDLTEHVGFAAVDLKAMGVSAAFFSIAKGLMCPNDFACMYVARPEDLGKDCNSTRPPLKFEFKHVAEVAHRLARATDGHQPLPNVGSATYEYMQQGLGYADAIAAMYFLDLYLKKLIPEDVEEYLYCLGDELRQICSGLGIIVLAESKRRDHAPHLHVLKLLNPG